ncbi:MAG: hypothetical protein AW07_04380 [Candidatus Accumulibacter sp. SK-11]|nr:MAG: hypothetical protein AW07_04380 [Candidatus Accumulibacter sp. SK-11]
MHDPEARVAHTVLAAHRFEVLLPALAVGRVGKHEVELAGGEGVVRQRGPLGAADDVVGALAFALEQHVGLADGVGLGVDLLSVEQAPDLLAAPGGDRRQRLLGDGEHAAGGAGAVVKQVGAGPDLGLDRPEHQVRHQTNRVARRPVLAGFFVVLLVELAHQFLENGAHRVVVDAGRREVDVGVEELVDQRADGVGPGQRLQLVAEFEVVEDVLDVGREAVEIVLEISQQPLLAAARLEVAQGETRGVVERLAGGIAECGALCGDARRVEHPARVEHLLLGRFEDGVQPPDDAQRQDHVRVLATLEEIAQDVVGDAPDERDDLVVSALVHYAVVSVAIVRVQPDPLRQATPIPAAAVSFDDRCLPFVGLGRGCTAPVRSTAVSALLATCRLKPASLLAPSASHHQVYCGSLGFVSNDGHPSKRRGRQSGGPSDDETGRGGEVGSPGGSGPRARQPRR